MRLKNLMAAATAASLIATPVLAANPAAKLSVAPAAARANAKAGKSELFGSGGFVVAAIAAAAVIAGIIIISNNDNDSN